MNVGDYVRFDGEIAKIINIKRYKTKEDIYFFDKILDLNEDRACNENTIYNGQWKYFDNVKSSPNIIDLLKPMDLLYIDIDNGYAGGIIVPMIAKTYCELKQIINEIKLGDYILKGVVTKEQLESMTYKVEVNKFE